MKLRRFALLTLMIAAHLFGRTAFALDCHSILEKAKTPKKGNPACTLMEHYAGPNRGSTVSVYVCGKSKFKLTTFENSDCTATAVK